MAAPPCPDFFKEEKKTNVFDGFDNTVELVERSDHEFIECRKLIYEFFVDFLL